MTLHTNHMACCGAESDAVKERDAELAAKSAQVAEMQKTIKALQQKHAKENEKAKGNAAARLPLSGELQAPSRYSLSA